MSSDSQENNMLVYSQTIETKGMRKIPLTLIQRIFNSSWNLVHGSFPNKTRKPRVLFSIRYRTSDNKSKIYKTASYKSRNLNNFIKEPAVKKLCRNSLNSEKNF